MSADFRVHSLSNLTEEELWEAVDELTSMVEDEIQCREEDAMVEEERQAKEKESEDE
jgi:hypothetical protein